MRWLILLLLLINGGYFAWQYYYIPGSESNKEDALEQGQEHDTLVLLSDLTEDRKELLGIINGDNENSKSTDGKSEKQIAKDKIKNKNEDTPKKPEPEDSIDSKQADNAQNKVAKPPKDVVTETLKADSKYCYVIGPIKNKAKISRLSKHIQSMGLEIQKVRKTIKKVPSHWIYLSGYKTENEAKKAIIRLAAKGVKDTQFIKRNATNFVVSVGLFSTKSGADERLKKLEDSGFTPQTSMVTANKSLYWLDLKYKDGQKVDVSLFNSLIKGMKDTKVKEGGCK